MENLRRSKSVGAKMPQRRAQKTLSANSPQVTQELNECWTSSMVFLEALLKFCGTSAQMAENFVRVFHNTTYRDSALQFRSATRDLYAATTSVSGQLKSKLDGWFMGIMTRDEDHSHVLAKCYLNLIQLHCQFVVTSTDVLAQFCNYSSIEDMQSHSKPEMEFPYSHVVSDVTVVPDVNVTDTDDVTQTFTCEDQTAVFASDGHCSPYGDIGSKVVRGQGQGHSPVKVTRSVPVSPVRQESRRAVDLVSGPPGEVVTEQELDNVVNFLSSTRLQPKPANQRPYSASVTSQSDNNSLTSSLGLSMTSSSSSGSDGAGAGVHMTLNHRLSDGAIDALREARNTWPYLGEAVTSQYGSSASLGSDPEFLSYVQSVGALLGQTSHIWTPQQQKTNHSWPVQKQPAPSPNPVHRLIRPPESSSSDGSVEENLFNMAADFNRDGQFMEGGSASMRRPLTSHQWSSRP